MPDQAAAYAMTLAIEVPIVVLASRAALPCVRWWRAAATGIAASSLTHPLAWWLWWRLGPQDMPAGFYAIEALVIVLETAVLKAGLSWSWPRAALLSAAANAASAGLGLLLWGDYLG